MSRNYFQHSTNYKTLNGLSNLTSFQGVDTSLIPGVDSTYDIGSPSYRWQEIFANTVAATGGTSTFSEIDVTGAVNATDLNVSGTASWNNVGANNANIANLQVGAVSSDLTMDESKIVYTNKLRSNPAGNTITVYDNLNVLGTLSYSVPPAATGVFGDLGDTEIGDLVTDPLDASPPEAADSNLQPAAERVLSAPTINATQWISTPFLTLMGLAQTDKLKVTSNLVPTSLTDYTNTAFWNEGGAIIQGRTFIDDVLNVSGTFSTGGNASIDGTLTTTGNATVTGNVTASQDIISTNGWYYGSDDFRLRTATGANYVRLVNGGTNTIVGNTAVTGTLATSGNATVGGAFVVGSVSGSNTTFTPGDKAGVPTAGWTTVDPNGGTDPTDGHYFYGKIQVENGVISDKTGAATSTTAGPNVFAGGIACNNTSYFTELRPGNTTIMGTLSCSGSAIVNGNLTVNSTFAADTIVGTNASIDQVSTTDALAVNVTADNINVTTALAVTGTTNLFRSTVRSNNTLGTVDFVWPDVTSGVILSRGPIGSVTAVGDFTPSASDITSNFASLSGTAWLVCFANRRSANWTINGGTGINIYGLNTLQANQVRLALVNVVSTTSVDFLFLN